MAMEDRAVAALGLGRHAMVAGELEVLTSTYPLRERLWGLRALALTRSGRQADALEVLRQVRELLADELGLEPGAELRSLQTAVLRQDPELEWTRVPPAPAAAQAGHASPAVRVAPGRPRRPALGARRAARAVGGAAGVRGGDRRARDRQEPAVRRARRDRHQRGSHRARRTVLPGRGRAAALPVGQRAPRARPRPALGRRTPTATRHVAVRCLGVDRAHRARRRRRAAPAGGARRPALGGHLDAAGAAPARRDRGVRSADGGRDLAPRAAADGPAGRGRRDDGPSARAAARAHRSHRRRGRRDRHLRGRLDPDRDRGRRAAGAHRRQPVLPGRVRPARARRRRPHRPAGRGASPGRRAGRAHPTARWASRGDGRRAAGGLRGRALLRRTHARGCPRRPTRTRCSTTSSRRCRRGWCGSSASTGSGSRTRWSATRRTPPSRRVAAPGCTRAWPRCSPGSPDARARSRATGSPPVRSTPRAPGRPHGRRRRRPAASMRTTRRWVCSRARCPSSSRIRTPPTRTCFALLLELARAHLLTDNLIDLRLVVLRALEVEERLEVDLDRRVDLLGLLATKALWQTGTYGQLDERVVATIRRLLEQLPPGDGVSRCRAMITPGPRDLLRQHLPRA